MTAAAAWSGWCAPAARRCAPPDGGRWCCGRCGRPRGWSAAIPGLCLVCDGTARSTPNLRFALPAELPALVRLLRAARPECDGSAQPAGPRPRGDAAAGAARHSLRRACARLCLAVPAHHPGRPVAPLLRRAGGGGGLRGLRRRGRPQHRRGDRHRRAARPLGRRACRRAPRGDPVRRYRRPAAPPLSRPRRGAGAAHRRCRPAAAPRRRPPRWRARSPGSAWSAASAPRRATTCCWPAPAMPPRARCRWNSCWSATRPTTPPCWPPAACSSPAPTRRPTAVAEIRAQQAHLGFLPSVCAGDLVLHPGRGLAGRARRGGVRHRRAGRTGAPHRPRLGVAARAADAGRSTTHCLQYDRAHAMNGRHDTILSPARPVASCTNGP